VPILIESGVSLCKQRSAFNIVIPHKLSEKLLALSPTLFFCNSVTNFLSDRPKSVRSDIKHQNHEHHPRLYAEPAAVHPLHTRFREQHNIIKLEDDTTVIGLIVSGKETVYRREMAGLVAWCQKTKLPLRRQRRPRT